MNAQVLPLWKSCNAFVAGVCQGRHRTHGLNHMQEVTELAMLTHSLMIPSGVSSDNNAGATAATIGVDPRSVYEKNCSSGSTTTASSWVPSTAAECLRCAQRICLVAMLHDVDDHKYDLDGTLTAKVESFVRDTCDQFDNGTLCHPAPGADSPVVLSYQDIMNAIHSVSYSKEKKQGMRWFTPEKQPDFFSTREWVYVRDVVSDADKLLAIGLFGLERCWAFQIERLEKNFKSNPDGLLNATAATNLTALLRLDARRSRTVSMARVQSERAVRLRGERATMEGSDEGPGAVAPPPLQDEGIKRTSLDHV